VSAPAQLTDEQVQQELLRLEAYRNQLNAMLQQHQLLSGSLADHRRARETLEGLESTEAGSEFVIPVGGEAYLRGSVAKDGKVLIGIGSGVVTEMDRPKASETLAERITRIEEARSDLESQMAQLEERIERLSDRLDSLARAAGGP
jgi:prefoldin alpha subunit